MGRSKCIELKTAYWQSTMRLAAKGSNEIGCQLNFVYQAQHFEAEVYCIKFTKLMMNVY